MAHFREIKNLKAQKTHNNNDSSNFASNGTRAASDHYPRTVVDTLPPLDVEEGTSLFTSDGGEEKQTPGLVHPGILGGRSSLNVLVLNVEILCQNDDGPATTLGSISSTSCPFVDEPWFGITEEYLDYALQHCSPLESGIRRKLRDARKVSKLLEEDADDGGEHPVPDHRF